MKTCAIAGLLSVASAIPALADGPVLDLSGQIDLGFRFYTEDGQYSGQGPAGYYPFIGMQLNGGMSVGPGELVFQFDGLGDDANDRSTFNIQKAYYTQSFDNWDLVVGYNVEDWGVSNGRTIVNVLNARDASNQVGGSELIGTPMLNANFFTGIGTFSAYVLGGDVSSNYGGQATRQRGPFPTYGDFATYQQDDELDVALRYSNYFSVGSGSLDFGLSYYQGTNREAVLLPGCVTTSGPVTPAICDQMSTALRDAYEAGTLTPTSVSEIAALLVSQFGIAVASEGPNVLAQVPYYQDIQQVGLTAVYAQGDTQFRFEGYVRETDNERFTAGIIGGDHTFYDFAGTDGTLILALEYHFDDRSVMQPATIFNDDAFLGLYYSLNDPNDSRVEFGLFQDLESSAQLYSLSLSRRIGDRMRAQISASHVETGSQFDPLTVLDGDTFFEFTLSTFF
ncbi:hypothetical protein [Nioella aestuarii]|uniref:hypothetical protein n=1 Tax=Nioella aestuarii TaxID=1662864 RepID=UPI003D7FEA6C